MTLKSNPRRGEIVRMRLDPVEGSEQGGTRPALVLSPHVINAHCPVILIAAVTSKKTERVYPFEVLIEPPEGGLTERSKVLLMHLRSVNRRRLIGGCGAGGDETMGKVEDALKVAVGLTQT